MTSPIDSRWRKRYRQLLRLFPVEFRSDFGEDMESVFRDQREDANRRSRPRALGLWMRTAFDVLRRAPSEHWDLIRQDLTAASRALRHRPAVTLIAIASLALGIGATAIVFSVIDAVLLRPLPFAAPHRLVTVVESNRANDPTTRFPVAPANFVDWRAEQTVFDGIGAWTDDGVTLTGRGDPVRLTAAPVSARVFTLLGVPPHIGRLLLPIDDRPDATPVAVLSHRIWRERFGGREDALEQRILLDGQAWTIVGVMPAWFRLPDAETDVWLPLERHVSAEDMRWRGSHYLTVVGRLRDGVTIDQARDVMSRLNARLKREHPGSTVGAGTVVLPLQDDVAWRARPVLVALGAAVTVVLLVACANVAALLLARALARRREISIRAALGAGRWRLGRQLAIESLVVSVAAASLGLTIAYVGLDTVLAMLPETMPNVAIVAIDWRIVAATVGVSAATGLVFGLVPAFGATRIDLQQMLRDGGRSATARDRLRLRETLVVGEVALALVLLVGSALLVQSFLRLRAVDLGFHTEGVLTARVPLPSEGYENSEARASAFDRILAAVRRTPGINHAAVTSILPLSGQLFDNSFNIEGRPPFPPGQFTFALIRTVDAAFFRMLGMTIERGRAFDSRDRADGSPVVIINQAMARRWWSGEDPLGQRMTIHMGPNPKPREIVGIVGDVRTSIDAQPDPIMYVPYPQLPSGSMVLTVQGDGQPAEIAAALARAVHSVDPRLPLQQVRSLEALVNERLGPWRFCMVLLSAFAGLGVLLAAIGLGGVIAHAVAERTNDIALRLALGASPGQVLREVLSGGAKLTLVGLALGIAVALAATRVVRTLLFDVSPLDPLSFALATLALALVALTAAWLPARKAARANPLTALRTE